MTSGFRESSWTYDPGLPVEQRRQYSSILADFPWRWSGIVSKPRGLEEFIDKIPSFRHFLRSLQTFESQMLSTRASQASSDVLALLGARIQYQPFPQPPLVVSTHNKELTAVEFQSIASVIAAYSFFELLVLRANLVPRELSVSLPTHMYLPPCRNKVQQDSYGMGGLLENWFAILFDFRRIMSKLRISNDNMDALKSNHSLVTLLRMVARSNTNNDYNKIENNLLHAALHMNAMESIEFPNDQVPDLPRDVHKSKYPLHIDPGLIQDVFAEDATVLNTISEDSSILEDLRLATALSNVGPSMLRNAFHTAGILSPILLLRPKQLIKMSLHRRTLLELAAKIRPCKTELLLRVEEKIWDVLFALSSGKETPLEVLQRLVRDLPWQEIDVAASLARARLEPASDSDVFHPSCSRLALPPPPHSEPGRISTLSPSDACTPGNGSLHDSRTSSFSPTPTASIPVDEPPPPIPPMLSASNESTYADDAQNKARQNVSLTFSSVNEDVRMDVSATQSTGLGGVVGETNACCTAEHVSAPDRSITAFQTPTSTPDSFTVDTSSSLSRAEQLDSAGTMTADDIQLNSRCSGHRSSDLTSILGNEETLSPLLDVVLAPTALAEESGRQTFSDQAGQVASSTQVLNATKEIGKTRITWTRNRTASVEDVDDDEALPLRTSMAHNSIFASKAPLDSLFSPSRSTFNLGGRAQSQLNAQKPKSVVLVTYQGTTRKARQGTETFSKSTTSSQVSSQESSERTSRKAPSSDNVTKRTRASTIPAPLLSAHLTANNATPDDHDKLPLSQLPISPLHGRDPASEMMDVDSDVDGQDDMPVDLDLSQTLFDSELSDVSSTSDDMDVDDYKPRGSSASKPLPGSGKKPSGRKLPNGHEVKGSKVPGGKGSKDSAPPGRGKSEDDNKQQVGKRGRKRPRNGEGDSLDNPIDVDKFHSIFEPSVVKEFVWNKRINVNLSKQKSTKVKHTQAVVAYGADKKETTFTPEAHLPIFLTSFQTFMDRMKDDYVDGKPRFVTAPDTSCLVIIDYIDYMQLDASAKQNLLKGKRAAIVRNWPVDPDLEFDEDGLSTVSPCLVAPIDLLDYTALSANERCRPRGVIGTAQDLLDNATPDGKILNGLDFPKWNGSLEPNGLAVDIDAWDYIRGFHFVDDRGASYPTPDMNWSLAATANAITNVHADADGTFTKNLIGCGRKGWGFIKDTRDVKLSSVNFFLHDAFCLDQCIEGSQYDVEFVVLQRGDMLLMKPGTPHFVITLDHSICYGGHLYCTTTMQDTLVSIIHTFVLDRYLTNAVHHPSRLLLRRILLLYHMGLVEGLVRKSKQGTKSKKEHVADHLPDVDKFDGVLDLLCVCVLVVMGNVLDFRSYTAPNQYDNTKAEKRLKQLMVQIDLNSIPENERRAICYARGVALCVMDWVRNCCTIKDHTGEIVEDLPSLFLVQIANSLVTYKKLAVSKSLSGAPHCTLTAVRLQVMNLIESDVHLRRMWAKKDQIPSDSLALKNKDNYTHEWKSSRFKWKGQSKDFFTDGLTAFDIKYFKGYNDWCQLQSEIVLPDLSSSPKPKKSKLS